MNKERVVGLFLVKFNENFSKGILNLSITKRKVLFLVLSSVFIIFVCTETERIMHF